MDTENSNYLFSTYRTINVYHLYTTFSGLKTIQMKTRLYGHFKLSFSYGILRWILVFPLLKVFSGLMVLLLMD